MGTLAKDGYMRHNSLYYCPLELDLAVTNALTTL